MINKFELIKLSDTLIYNYNLSYDILKFSSANSSLIRKNINSNYKTSLVKIVLV